MQFERFASWADVLGDADRGRPIYYHAPLDTTPVLVVVRKIFKNGKLRLNAGYGSFTVDSSHLVRLRRRPLTVEG